jgi:glycosyl hydrolase family 18 (putative chitinase)
MGRTRLLAAVAALLCAGGMATGAAVTGAAAAAPDPVLPAHVFAPYYSNTADTLAKTSAASGAKYITLAFLQTAKPGSCTVYWNGSAKQPVGPTYASGIAAIQAAGGDVVPSFGGASADSAGEELADSCHSVAQIAAQYEKVIEAYHTTRLDLDTEENSLNNYAGIDRRNKAIAMVERWAAATGRVIQFVYTIPTNTTGVDQGGSYVLQNAVANGATIAIVNVMTFDYYDNLPHEIGDETIGAATQLYNRLHTLYPGKTSAQLWGMIGVTEDLGVDDFGAAETFTLADAHTVEAWAAARGLAEVSFWNLQDDNTAGSHVQQSPYEYSRILAPFTSSAPVSSGPLAPAAALLSHGNMRSVSCPTASFCMAVDQYGNDALTYNGSSWSAPVPVGPASMRDELNSVSCSSPSWCVAVDTLGHAYSWNGSRWTSWRVAGIGLTSVSCPSSSFCVAVDGWGDAHVWDGSSWSTTAVDSSGSSLQSVSCAAVTFCAAGDWNGNVFVYDGHRWSAADPVDPAGGGVSSLSCPSASFCVGTDWNGGSVLWNGAAWKLKTSFDANAAGGLMSVSCVSAVSCVAVDGSGDYLTWNGVKWTAPVMIDLTGDGFESLSCGSASACVAVDWNGNALAFNGSSWTAPAIACPSSSTNSAGTCSTRGSYVDPRAGVLDAVSCASAAFCVAVDGNGNASVSGTVSDIDPIAGILTSVSCVSSSFCAAVDSNGYALLWRGSAWSVPSWSASSPVDKRGPLVSVSCVSASWCVAVDENGYAVTFNGLRWSAPALIDPAGQLTGVSCASAGACAAVDAHGNALVLDGARWVSVPLGAGRALTGVSCPSVSFCAVSGAVGAYTLVGDAASGGGFRSPVAGGLTAVSCASARSCVAVGASGDLVRWNGVSWSAPVTVDRDGGGLTGVSCARSGSCVAVDFAGRTIRVAA